MKVTRHRRLTVRMGNYESLEIFAGIEYDPAEQVKGYDPDAELDFLVFSDIEDAHLTTDESDSFVHTYYEDLEKRIHKS